MSGLSPVAPHVDLLNLRGDAGRLFLAFSALAAVAALSALAAPRLTVLLRRGAAAAAASAPPISREKLLELLALHEAAAAAATAAAVKAVTEHERRRALRAKLGERSDPLPLSRLLETIADAVAASDRGLYAAHGVSAAEVESAFEHFDACGDGEVKARARAVREAHPLFVTPKTLLAIHSEMLEAEFAVYVAAKAAAEAAGVPTNSRQFGELLDAAMRRAGGTVLRGEDVGAASMPCLTAATLAKHGLVHKAMLWSSILAFAHEEERQHGGGRKGPVAAGIERSFVLHRDRLGKLGLLAAA